MSTRLEEIMKKMEDVTGITPEMINEYRLLVCQQVLIDFGITKGEDIVKMNKDNMIVVLDNIANMVNFPNWVPQDSIESYVQPEIEAEDIELEVVDGPEIISTENNNG
jgi:hypothetical protein